MKTPSRSSFHQRLVARPGICRSTSRASASAAVRTCRKSCSGVRRTYTWMPREPEVLGKPSRPCSSSTSRTHSATSRTWDEGDVRLGVEVDAQLVRVIQIGAPHRPRVPVDHAQVHAPHQVRGVVGHQLTRVAAAGKRHGGRLQPLRRAVGHALLKERLALHAVHPALHHRRAIAQAAHDRVGALDVVVGQVQLGQLAFGKEQLAGVAQAQLLAADVDRGRLGLLGCHCWKDARSCLRGHCSSPPASSTISAQSTWRMPWRRACAIGGWQTDGCAIDAPAAGDLRAAAGLAGLRFAHACRARAGRLPALSARGHAGRQRRLRDRHARAPERRARLRRHDREPPRFLRRARARPPGDRAVRRQRAIAARAARKLAALV